MADFLIATQPVLDLAKEIIQKHYPELNAHGVTYQIWFAYGPKHKKTGVLKGPALKDKGTPLAGTCKITSAKDRREGKPDFIVYLDGDRWPEWSPKEQRSLLHHELHHVLLCREKLDAAERPKLTYRPHDAELGVFKYMIDLYGPESLDHVAVRQAAERLNQPELFQ